MDTFHQERSRLAVDFLYFLTPSEEIGKGHHSYGAWNLVRTIQEMYKKNVQNITYSKSVMLFMIVEVMNSRESPPINITAERDFNASASSAGDP